MYLAEVCSGMEGWMRGMRGGMGCYAGFFEIGFCEVGAGMLCRGREGWCCGRGNAASYRECSFGPM